jgi:large subunit ribosomal protein L27e
MIFEKERIVIILKGKYAGAKVVVVGEPETIRGDIESLTVVGMSRIPRPVSENMSERQRKRREEMKVFLKKINIQHVLATRHTLENVIDRMNLSIDYAETAQRREAEKTIKKVFQEVYSVNPGSWIFKKLVF